MVNVMQRDLPGMDKKSKAMCARACCSTARGVSVADADARTTSQCARGSSTLEEGGSSRYASKVSVYDLARPALEIEANILCPLLMEGGADAC